MRQDKSPNVLSPPKWGQKLAGNSRQVAAMQSPNPVSSSHWARIFSTVPFEVLTRHKEPLAFCARKIRAPQGAVKMVLMLVKPPLENCAFLRSLHGIKSPYILCHNNKGPTMWSQGGSNSGETGLWRSLPGIKNP
jgi:hypothetical protein